ncbi:MAG TPA: ATP-dependent Clp protease adapter ClpS [Candidatus Rifleibacterium sp.]|jgi:ATP-dependent Clp protease adaptor protein ClpS|nr:ATP-dependent Clp protease adapter ClpS [Candidatus Ozemobacteraceae bacterium]HNW12628.1 ATP-dependent Clp protease adapter ClpS [Candidatus Rifleibacterium sp.]HOI89354.1 ATP-dependent Clp protease adapter ClpS [Candidatus Rifleibacterium sp.]HPW57757.1 ATP-dependent Clp protease adapter ClpS [Candidatus Rifleibacterium sp.]
MGQNEDSPQRGVVEKTRQKTTKPSMYKVFLLNDDYTTMEFVVEVLERVFGRSKIDATSIMLHVHRNGKGLAGVYTREIAETKIAQVHALARENGFPLKCDMEKE